MINKPRLLDGAMAHQNQRMSAEILCAPIELAMYAHFSELVEEHSLGGCCRRTVWNRELPDHHYLLVVLS